jgi:hypothetical protein
MNFFEGSPALSNFIVVPIPLTDLVLMNFKIEGLSVFPALIASKKKRVAL